LDVGIIPLDNMIPETALMKLGWVLGRTDDPHEIKAAMQTPINHEITEREPHNAYLILQGGLPETEKFIMSHWK
jgi:glutamyl-tRNA(Gln) amidotransferase subunit D